MAAEPDRGDRDRVDGEFDGEDRARWDRTWTTGEGLLVPVGAPGRSSTSPMAESSPSRSAIVRRLRPVVLVARSGTAVPPGGGVQAPHRGAGAGSRRPRPRRCARAGRPRRYRSPGWISLERPRKSPSALVGGIGLPRRPGVTGAVPSAGPRVFRAPRRRSTHEGSRRPVPGRVKSVICWALPRLRCRTRCEYARAALGSDRSSGRVYVGGQVRRAEPKGGRPDGTSDRERRWCDPRGPPSEGGR